VACPTTREFRGLCPFDLGIKGGHRSVEVATIKCGIRGTKLLNDFVMSHGCLLTLCRLLRIGKSGDD
jgi:hypothetical protein